MINLIYITTDLSTGKQYVGDHCTENINDSYLGSGTYLKRAIRKYGRNNFSREILEEFETKRGAFEAQERYIKEYNTLVPNGYNISPKGGSQIVGGLSEETKRKIGLFFKGKKSPMAGKHHSERSKKQISEGRMGEKNWNFGKPRTKECRNKIRDSLKISIIQMDKDENFIKKWNSAIEIEETMGIARGNICKVCKGIRPMAGGFKWKYTK